MSSLSERFIRTPSGGYGRGFPPPSLIVGIARAGASSEHERAPAHAYTGARTRVRAYVRVHARVSPVPVRDGGAVGLAWLSVGNASHRGIRLVRTRLRGDSGTG